jgi:hypothetical protein
LQPKGAGGFVCLFQCSFGGFRIGGIDQHGNASGLGNKLVEEIQPLRGNLLDEKIDAGRVAAWPGEARDQTKLRVALGHWAAIAGSRSS